jgi:hypothetical protein
MRKPKLKNDGSREFRPAWFTRLWIWAVVGVCLFLAVYIAYNDAATWYMLVFAVPLFGFASWFGFIQATQMTLTVRDDGLEYRFGSGVASTSWGNLIRFTRRDSGKVVTLGLDLRQKVRQEVRGGKLDRFFFGAGPVTFIPLSTIVPVPMVYDKHSKKRRVDTEKFAKTPFGQELLHYAPHLFEEGARQIKEITK